MNAFSACTSVQLLKKLVKTNTTKNFVDILVASTYMNNTTHVYLENSKM